MIPPYVWVERTTALKWPRGSVVLCKLKDERSTVHNHSYALSLYWTQEAFISETFNDWQFLLVESPKHEPAGKSQQPVAL